MHQYDNLYLKLDLSIRINIWNKFILFSKLNKYISTELSHSIGQKNGYNPLNLFSKTNFLQVYNILNNSNKFRFKDIINNLKSQISKNTDYLYNIIPCHQDDELYWDCIFKLRTYKVLPIPIITYALSGYPAFELLNSKWKFKFLFKSYQETRLNKNTNYFIYDPSNYDIKKLEKAKQLNVLIFTYGEFINHHLI